MDGCLLQASGSPCRPVREYFQDNKDRSTFHVQAGTACTSLIGMENQSNSKMEISFNLSRSDIRLIPYVPGQEFEWTFTPCTFYPGKNRYECSLNDSKLECSQNRWL